MTLTTQDIELLSRYIVESDAIERITRSPDEVARQIKVGRKRGHVGAYGHLLLAQQDGELISEEMIQRVQGLIVTEQTAYGQRKLPKQWVGKWRNVGVSVGGRNCPHPSTVPTSMEQFVRRVHAWQKHGWALRTPEENVRFIAMSHFYYLTIHPFADGNGRSSRALVYHMYRHAQLTPFVFTSADRYETYYQCFNDKNDASDMVAYFLSRTALPEKS